MSNRALVPAAIILAALAVGCQPTTRSIQMIDGKSREWSDETAVFQFAVSGGHEEAPLLCVFSIENRADRTMTFPVPLIMPFAGTTSKNNVVVSTADGDELSIEGTHWDFFKGDRPAVELEPGSTASWPFSLDYHFPDLWKEGQYRIGIRYFAEGGGPEFWSGTVRMEPVNLSIRVSKGWG
jgi:hypothetical protein